MERISNRWKEAEITIFRTKKKTSKEFKLEKFFEEIRQGSMWQLVINWSDQNWGSNSYFGLESLSTSEAQLIWCEYCESRSAN